jgi:hypothetical protein
LAFVLLLSLAGRKYAVCCRVAVDFEGFGFICCLLLRVPNLTGFGRHNQRKESTGRSAKMADYHLRVSTNNTLLNLPTSLDTMHVP